MYDQTQFIGWEDFDWFDLYPEVGAFVSPTRADYEIQGEIVNALNYEHARHTWLKRKLNQSGEEWGKCCHCNHNIRYAVIFKDKNNNYHITGQDCAHFINSKFDVKKYREQQMIREIKKINTKNGEKFVYKDEVPQWLWAIAKENRPKFLSLSKWDKPVGRRMVPVWYYTIWGDNVGEVLTNYQTFKKLNS